MGLIALFVAKRRVRPVFELMRAHVPAQLTSLGDGARLATPESAAAATVRTAAQTVAAWSASVFEIAASMTRPPRACPATTAVPTARIPRRRMSQLVAAIDTTPKAPPAATRGSTSGENCPDPAPAVPVATTPTRPKPTAKF